ncbi:MAG: hypothetical protein AAFS10_23140, partial [Myxococcota bacterium]
EPGDSVIREKLTVPGFWRFAMPGFFFLMAILMFVTAFLSLITPVMLITGSLGVLMLLLTVFMFSMITLRVNVTQDAIVIQNGSFGPTIPIKHIELCEPVAYSAMREYGGWGIRHGRDGTWAYNILGDKGKGVRIHYREEDGTLRKVMFSSERHNTMAETINRLRATEYGHDVGEQVTNESADALEEAVVQESVSVQN